MKVRFINCCKFKGKYLAPGAVIDLDDTEAQAHIAAGSAEPAKGEPEKSEAFKIDGDFKPADPTAPTAPKAEEETPDPDTQTEIDVTIEGAEDDEDSDPVVDLTAISGVGPKLAESLVAKGVATIADVAACPREGLLIVKGITEGNVDKIMESAQELATE